MITKDDIILRLDQLGYEVEGDDGEVLPGHLFLGPFADVGGKGNVSVHTARTESPDDFPVDGFLIFTHERQQRDKVVVFSQSIGKITQHLAVGGGTADDPAAGMKKSYGTGFA